MDKVEEMVSDVEELERQMPAFRLAIARIAERVGVDVPPEANVHEACTVLAHAVGMSPIRLVLSVYKLLVCEIAERAGVDISDLVDIQPGETNERTQRLADAGTKQD